MAKVNLSLPNLDPNMTDAQAVRKIQSYLFQLVEQMRYELTHIDEDNMTGSTDTAGISEEEMLKMIRDALKGENIDLGSNASIMQINALLENLSNALSKANQTLEGKLNTALYYSQVGPIKRALLELAQAYAEHLHSITIDGSGQLSMGPPTEEATFPNIADTAYFQNAVSAAENGVGFDTETLWNDGAKTLTLTNGKTRTVNIPDATNVSGTYVGNNRYAISFLLGGKSFNLLVEIT